MSGIANKVIWITGASSGIGEALAKQLAVNHNKLILSARRTEELERVKNELPVAGRQEAAILPLDLADAGSLSDKARQALQLFGRIDILIHSGGISQRSLTIDTDMAVYRRLMEVNFFGTIALTKAVLPDMIAKNYGHIVVISSVVGKIGSPYRSGYAASKHALHGFFDSLRAELYGKNMYVTLVTPGFVRTAISQKALTADGREYKKMDEGQAKGMPAEECAAQIVKAIEHKKYEIAPGGKEILAIYLKRFFPGIFAKVLPKAKVR